MSDKLIVKSKTEIAMNAHRKDVLSLYGVPLMLDQIVKKEKIDLLNKMNCGAVIIDSLNKLAHSDDFFVEIPSGFREMLKSGKATFDQSHQNPGGFTPNIRIKGESGIKGQATIMHHTDSQAITQSLSNLAMMAMVQSVLEKLSAIEEKIEDIKQGQKDDRIGEVIGHFKGFMDLYPTFKSQEELRYAANMAYMNMEKGLSQIHLQIDQERERLAEAPKNNFQSFLKSIQHPLRNDAIKYQQCYRDYVHDLQLYNRLILLSDVVLHLKGDSEAMNRNHKVMDEYIRLYIDDHFQQNMSYLMNKKIDELKNVLIFNENIRCALAGSQVNDLAIECKKEDIKYFKTK